MNTLQERIVAFVRLGEFLSQFTRSGIFKKEGVEGNDLFFEDFKQQLKFAQQDNGWFTQDNLLHACESWAEALNQENLSKWLRPYPAKEGPPRTVAIVMAGNIPMVGFHDLLSVLITGNDVLAKLSSNDKRLLPFVAKYLGHISPSFKGKIRFTESKLTDLELVIATGSNNTARYFEYYFGKVPSIIRRNRNSVAVLEGTESKAQLEALGEDVFRYFGLGCRSVSKVFVPRGYDLDQLFGGMYLQRHVIDQTKYANNYDYNKAVYLMSQYDFLDNGFLMLKEDTGYASPIGTLFYEYYENSALLEKKLAEDAERLQCVVANKFGHNAISFGKTQRPSLWDYADGVDTVEFLLKNS